MANTLNQVNIETGNIVEAYHVTQSIDAFTGVVAYDISLSGSFNMTGSINGEPGIINPLTASYAISTSYAETASYVLSSSYAETSSYTISSSYSNTSTSASHAIFTNTASYALTASYSHNLTISGSINNVDYIDFNTGSATPSWKSGRVFWDNTEGALSVYNAEADITLQIGQENWTRVSNRTGTTITNGTVVRLKGAHGDVPEIERAQSLAMSGSVNVLNQILGVATHDIEHDSKGYVTTQGLVRGLNTSMFNDGDTLFVGTGSSGVLTKTPPKAPYEIIPVGVCVKASPGGSGIIYVAVQEPIDFSDLSSVLVEGTYNYGDLWVYQPSGSLGVWKHTNQLSGSYGLTGSLNATSFTGSLFGTASYAVTASHVPNTFIQNGNSFGTTARLGTNDSQPLVFETNGLQRMNISNAGIIGMGDGNHGTLFNLLNGTITTSNASSLTLLTLPTIAGVSYTVHAYVTGYGGANGKIGGEVIGVFQNVAGTLTSAGSPIANIIEDFTGSPTFTLTTSGTSIILQVTGQAATDIAWAGHMKYIQYDANA